MKRKSRILSMALALTLLVSVWAGGAVVAHAAAGGNNMLQSATLVRSPVAAGTATKASSQAVIDYSNAKDGYVMIRWTGESSAKLKVQIKGPKTADSYKYDLRADGVYETFPFSDGNGDYTVGVYQNVAGTNKYSTALTATITVQLTDEFVPFLHPNKFVNYTETSQAVAVAAKACQEANAVDNLSKVSVIYNYVVSTLSYDDAKAQSVKSGYVPDIDTILASKKGICFDYAALMAAMLRSQDVPVKMIFGYTSTGEYHAWLNVWSSSDGWVNSVIYFDGKDWKLMDPTFASTGKSSNSTMQYINNSANYTAKWVY